MKPLVRMQRSKRLCSLSSKITRRWTILFSFKQFKTRLNPTFFLDHKKMYFESCERFAFRLSLYWKQLLTSNPQCRSYCSLEESRCKPKCGRKPQQRLRKPWKLWFAIFFFFFLLKSQSYCLSCFSALDPANRQISSICTWKAENNGKCTGNQYCYATRTAKERCCSLVWLFNSSNPCKHKMWISRFFLQKPPESDETQWPVEAGEIHYLIGRCNWEMKETLAAFERFNDAVKSDRKHASVSVEVFSTLFPMWSIQEGEDYSFPFCRLTTTEAWLNWDWVKAKVYRISIKHWPSTQIFSR